MKGHVCIYAHYIGLWTGFQFDYVFDWTILKYQQSQLAAPPARAVVSVSLFLIFHLSNGYRLLRWQDACILGS